jgi:hypothetical protein
LVTIEQTDTVVEALKAMGDESRAQVIGKLAPRLWNVAKPQSEGTLPTRKNAMAKDALFSIRDLATVQARDQIDGYLVDWLGTTYDARVGSGQYNGELIVRAVGPKMAPKLVAEARAIVKAPPQGNMLIKVTDDLLRAVALTAAPEAVEFLLDLADPPKGTPKHPDEELGIRAMGALQYAFNEYERPVAADGLVPHLERLVKIAGDDSQDGRNANVSFELIRATGKPHCIKPLAQLASHRDEVRMWQAVQTGIRCGGAESIVAMAEALPQDRKIPIGIFEKYFWDKVVALGPDGATAARTLLGSASWVGRITGIHLLARVGNAQDASAVRKLAGDKTRLKGWWGERDKTGRKPDPTLGSEAVSVADLLEKKR